MSKHKAPSYFWLFSLAVASILFAGSALAETRNFIKEYTYQASEDDSRNSSRVIALREVKRLLLEELGTYLESETEVKDFQLTKDQITTLTAGIVQTEIVDEKWDGRVYWLKAKIAADPGKVAESMEDHLLRAWTYKELENRDLALQEFGKAIETASGNKEKAAAYWDWGEILRSVKS